MDEFCPMYPENCGDISVEDDCIADSSDNTGAVTRTHALEDVGYVLRKNQPMQAFLTE